MNTQEQEKLTSFLQQLQQAQVGAKDYDAEKLILEACSRQPDAHYLLVQRSLLLDQALQNAQAEIAQLKKKLESPKSNTASFLDNNAWGNSPVQAVATAARSATFTPASAPVAAPPGAATPAGGSFLNSGMLGTVASTAVGVVAGSFLYHGIENMMGNHNNKSSLLSENTPPVTPAPAENLAANTNYDSSNNINDLDALSPDAGDSDWV